MSKIETNMIFSICERMDYSVGNTTVRFTGDRFTVRLYGNLIAKGQMLPEPPGWWDDEAVHDPEEQAAFDEKYGDEIGNGYRLTYVTLAGWDTQTTRSRLRALGVDVRALREKEGYIAPRKRKAARTEAAAALAKTLADPETKETLRILGI